MKKIILASLLLTAVSVQAMEEKDLGVDIDALYQRLPRVQLIIESTGKDFDRKTVEEGIKCIPAKIKKMFDLVEGAFPELSKDVKGMPELYEQFLRVQKKLQRVGIDRDLKDIKLQMIFEPENAKKYLEVYESNIDEINEEFERDRVKIFRDAEGDNQVTLHGSVIFRFSPNISKDTQQEMLKVYDADPKMKGSVFLHCMIRHEQTDNLMYPIEQADGTVKDFPISMIYTITKFDLDESKVEENKPFDLKTFIRERQAQGFEPKRYSWRVTGNGDGKYKSVSKILTLGFIISAKELETKFGNFEEKIKLNNGSEIDIYSLGAKLIYVGDKFDDEVYQPQEQILFDLIKQHLPETADLKTALKEKGFLDA